MRKVEVGQQVLLNDFGMPHFIRSMHRGTGAVTVGKLKPDEIEAIGRVCRALGIALGNDENVAEALSDPNHTGRGFEDLYERLALGTLDDCEQARSLTADQQREVRLGLRTLALAIPAEVDELGKEEFELGVGIVIPRELEDFEAIRKCPFQGYARVWHRVARKVIGERK